MKNEFTNNAEQVLASVEKYIKNYEYPISIYRVCDELSIFDWWVDNLSRSKLKDMRRFLREAIKLGYTGYVCFKVGAKYCANGMWAHKKSKTEDGYSPDGAFLYKSFTPDYNYWDIQDDDGKFITHKNHIEYDSITTIKQLEDTINRVRF